MRVHSLCIAIACAAAMTLPAWAHHSHGNYDMTGYINLEGTVSEIHWLTPHSWIYLEVAGNDGETALWALEGASGPQLRRRGWTEDSIKAGDPITVRCHHLQDRSNGCLLGFVTTDGGEEKLFD